MIPCKVTAVCYGALLSAVSDVVQRQHFSSFAQVMAALYLLKPLPCCVKKHLCAATATSSLYGLLLSSDIEKYSNRLLSKHGSMLQFAIKTCKQFQIQAAKNSLQATQ